MFTMTYNNMPVMEEFLMSSIRYIFGCKFNNSCSRFNEGSTQGTDISWIYLWGLTENVQYVLKYTLFRAFHA